jgi:hypothetical protein
VEVLAKNRQPPILENSSENRESELD